MTTASVASDVHQFRRTMQRLFRRFGVLANDATPCGRALSIAHAHALMVLLARGELPQRELAQELCIDKSNVARLCARMGEAGHVRQRVGEDDGRSRRVSLTASGRRLARDVEGSSTERFRQLLLTIAPKNRPTILGALGELLAAVESLPNSDAP